MGKIAIVTDSNSGITIDEGRQHGITVIPMPFMIDGKEYFEELSISQDEFYRRLQNDANIITSQPAIGKILECWDDLLREYDQIVHIPMSSGLSASCETALQLAKEYPNKVYVVDNQRISVTMKQSVYEARSMADKGYDAREIHDALMREKLDASIYITVNTMKYLKKGGRVTAAGAALGSLLKIKPCLEIQGGKLDAFAKPVGMKQAKRIMIQAMKNDFENRFKPDETHQYKLHIAYTYDLAQAELFKKEVELAFPGYDVDIDPLSLSVACHIGPGALALACAKILNF